MLQSSAEIKFDSIEQELTIWTMRFCVLCQVTHITQCDSENTSVFTKLTRTQKLFYIFREPFKHVLFDKNGFFFALFTKIYWLLKLFEPILKIQSFLKNEEKKQHIKVLLKFIGYEFRKYYIFLIFSSLAIPYCKI